MGAIEDIILDRDRRGIAQLRAHLPDDFCDQAAGLILERPGRVLIGTGFYILGAGAPETDGPPGALFLGQALQALGYSVTYVTDRYSAFLFQGLASPDSVVEFPVVDDEASERYARLLLARLKPSVVVAIERCGMTASRRYLNMRGVDITEYTARLDSLVLHHKATIGIGDGGNEIGMGNLAEHIPLVPSLPREPNTTRVSHLVIASVSNWGAYGLAAALSLRQAQNLLPAPEREEEVIRHMVDRGAVDGIEVRPVYGVDGFSLEENRETLERLHALLRRHRLGKPLRSS
ncbi:MAG: DUF4392 domain-containing protein [Chloroflexi bacterium]|nr:DUF4392 domain-containing protein [Chloroflexota bacterium]